MSITNCSTSPVESHIQHITAMKLKRPDIYHIKKYTQAPKEGGGKGLKKNPKNEEEKKRKMRKENV